MNETQLAALKARADADDPVAMFDYAQYIRSTDIAESDKLIALAAQLGFPPAAEFLGDKCMDADDHDAARLYYRVGAKGGLDDCAVKLAVLNLSENEHAALKELEALAESGVRSACSALAAYYKSKGNRKEYNFWRKLLE